MRSDIDFSVIEAKRVDKKLCCSRTYGRRTSVKMNQLIFLFIAFLAVLSEFVAGEFPGRRRQLSPVNAEKQYLIEQLASYIDAQARLKFKQQIENHNLHYSHQRPHHQEETISGPAFSFELPPITKDLSNGEINFAVPPFDSRYYEQTPIVREMESNDDDDDIEVIDEAPVESDVSATTIKSSSSVLEGGIGRNLIPSPMHVFDGTRFESVGGDTNSRILHRAQQKQQQLQQKQKNDNDVMQKPLQVESTSLYIVALIAGLSCAFSTGLIALGLMYWTLKKKVKSADACDYASCDYGVVGPRSMKNNLDQVAAGDKKLAHSAQMFHYQHQKNQIIAMENRNGADLSHVDEENDSDDNENDFTVYECPGLAEFGHNMEVKNPLFSEETPASKSDKTEKGQPQNKTTK